MLHVVSFAIEKIAADREADAVEREGKAAAVSVEGTLDIGADAFRHQKQQHDQHPTDRNSGLGPEVVKVNEKKQSEQPGEQAHEHVVRRW